MKTYFSYPIKIQLLIFLLSVIGTIQVFAQEANINTASTVKELHAVTAKQKVRLSRIEIDSARMEEYYAFLKEEIKTSLRLEPGVLTLYAAAEKEHPYKITILEIYASEEAYQSHIKTPHFLKYKEGTLDMVLKLELIDADPLIE